MIECILSQWKHTHEKLNMSADSSHKWLEILKSHNIIMDSGWLSINQFIENQP